jgi:hypothetical protein
MLGAILHLWICPFCGWGPDTYENLLAHQQQAHGY